VKRPTSSDALAALVRQVHLAPEAEAGRVTWAEALLPVKDAPILAAAIASKADVLATGDHRHFEPLFGQVIEGVVVLTPREALERVLTG
jgi:predicted nucleic acid-binding protein